MGGSGFCLMEAPEFKTERMMLLFHLVLYGVYTGRFDKATLALEMLSALTQTLEIRSPIRGWGYSGEALFFEVAGFPEKCQKSVHEGLEFSSLGVSFSGRFYTVPRHSEFTEYE